MNATHTVIITDEDEQFEVEIPNAEIPQEMENSAPDWWVVTRGMGCELLAVCGSLDEATRFVVDNVAENLSYVADLKDKHCDCSDPRVPSGAVTALRWRAPRRPMTREEICNHPTIKAMPQFRKQWLSNPPNTPTGEHADLAAVSITRGTREIGYIRRSGYLNDKTRYVAKLRSAYALRFGTNAK